MTEPRDEETPEPTLTDDPKTPDIEVLESDDVVEADVIEPEILTPEEQEIRALQEQVSALTEERDGIQSRLRAVSKAYRDREAEMDTIRERLRKQGEVQAARRANSVVETIFEPVQNLKRSLEAGKQDPEGLVTGLEMVLHQFMEAFGRLGLEEVPGVGADFDPKVHEALAMMPVTDPEQDGKVHMVYTSGYTIGGKLLQPSQVVIGKYSEDEAPPEA